MRLILACLALTAPLAAEEFAPADVLRAAREAQTPATPAARPAGRHPIPLYDRAALPRALEARLEAARAALVADYADPRFIRFKIPQTKAYVEKITRRLLAASALPAVVVQVNDTSWGAPGAELRAGVLVMDPEGVAIMKSEDQVAALIAHELAHHVRGHDVRLALKVKRPDSGGHDIFSSPAPSRTEIELRWAHEKEADELSVLILANAGYDPSAALAALEAVRQERQSEPRHAFGVNLTDLSHPPIETRAKIIAETLTRAGLAAVARTALDKDVYRELAGRRRSEKPEDVPASALYQHYKSPR